MVNTMQTSTQNVLEHGQSVWSYTQKLIAGQWDNMQLPQWFTDNHVEIVNNLHPTNTLKTYNIYHDCGKPFCLTIDEDGKRHFPNHASVSANTFKNYFDDEIAAKLIGDDMCLHTLNAEQIDAKDWCKRDAFTLLITALAELHANANMFGGIESTSFKIKWKKLDGHGKRLCKKYINSDQPHHYSYIITRNDLPTYAKIIQSVHAGIESFNTEDYTHHSVVGLMVKTEHKLKSVIVELLDKNVSLKIFREPLNNNEITAICTEPLIGERRDLLKRFQLLT